MDLPFVIEIKKTALKRNSRAESRILFSLLLKHNESFPIKPWVCVCLMHIMLISISLSIRKYMKRFIRTISWSDSYSTLITSWKVHFLLFSQFPLINLNFFSEANHLPVLHVHSWKKKPFMHVCEQVLIQIRDLKLTGELRNLSAMLEMNRLHKFTYALMHACMHRCTRTRHTNMYHELSVSFVT